MSEVEVRLAMPADLPAVAELYREWGYRSAAQPSDVLVVAERAGRLVGVVRMVHERGYTLLRGMRVQPELQRGGVGTRMLQLFVSQLSGDCYCIPYPHLFGFYGQVGFREISEESAPAFLVERVRAYRTEGRDYAIMYRPG